jgi:multicomponent Na+:H+ antiporter subunit G
MTWVQNLLSGVLIGAALIFMGFGVIGMFRLRNFYARILISAKVDTVGFLTMMAGIMVSAGFSFFSLKLGLITALVLLTNPIATHAIARSAHRRLPGLAVPRIMRSCSLLPVVFAVARSSRQLRRHHLPVFFSLLASLAYLLYQAPDVAIAEAVIGCGLATVLYLAALRKQRLITIYYVHEHDGDINDRLTKQADRLLRAIEQLLAEKELETQVIHTARPGREVLDRQDFDLLLRRKGSAADHVRPDRGLPPGCRRNAAVEAEPVCGSGPGDPAQQGGELIWRGGSKPSGWRSWPGWSFYSTTRAMCRPNPWRWPSTWAAPWRKPARPTASRPFT